MTHYANPFDPIPKTGQEAGWSRQYPDKADPTQINKPIVVTAGDICYGRWYPIIAATLTLLIGVVRPSRNVPT